MFHVLAAGLGEDRDVKRLHGLVVALAHPDFAGVDLEAHVFERQRNLLRIERLGLVHRLGHHLHHVVYPQVVEPDAGILFVEVEGEFLGVLGRHVHVPFGELQHLAFARGAHGLRRAEAAGVVGDEACVQLGVLGGLDQQREVVAPVAGDHGVGAGGLDLGDVGREILDAADRMQVVADDLHVLAFLRQHFLGVLRHLVAVGIVLADDENLLHLLVTLQEVGDRLHLHFAVGIEAEVPEAAFLVGQRRVDGGVVEEEHGLVGIARVPLVDRVDQRVRRARAVALSDVTKALVDRRLELDLAFLGAALVVEADEFELLALDAALLVDQDLGGFLEALEAGLADVGKGPGKRVDVGDLDLRVGAAGSQRETCDDGETAEISLLHAVLLRILVCVAASRLRRPSSAVWNQVL